MNIPQPAGLNIPDNIWRMAVDQASEQYRQSQGQDYLTSSFGDVAQRADVTRWLVDISRQIQQQLSDYDDISEQTERYMNQIKQGKKVLKDEALLRQQVTESVRRTATLTTQILTTNQAIGRNEVKAADLRKRQFELLGLRVKNAKEEEATQKRINALQEEQIRQLQRKGNYQRTNVQRAKMTQADTAEYNAYKAQYDPLKKQKDAYAAAGDKVNEQAMLTQMRLLSSQYRRVKTMYEKKENVAGLSDDQVATYLEYRQKRDEIDRRRADAVRDGDKIGANSAENERVRLGNDKRYKDVIDYVAKNMLGVGRQAMEEIDTRLAAGKVAMDGFKNATTLLNDSIDNWDDSIVKLEATERRLGIIFKGVSELGKTRLGKFLDFDDAAVRMRGAYSVGGSDVSNGRRYMNMLKAGGDSLLSGLAGKLVSVKAGWEVLEFIVSSMNMADKRVTKLAKSFGQSKEEAAKLYDAIGDRVSHTDASYEDLIDAQVQFNENLGVAFQINEKLNIALAESAKLMGLSEEASRGLAENTIVSGRMNEDLRETILGTSKILQLRSKNFLNDRQILESVLKTTGGIRASFKGNLEDLTKAVTQAKLYGMEMSQIEKTGMSLLDWQSSIDSELEAELLTQRSLNLEKARAYALTNDMAGLTREMRKEIGGLDGFLRGNVLQQQALAKAFGMSRDEMSDMLFKAEMMNKLQRITERNLDKANIERWKQLKVDLTENTAFRQKYEEIMKRQGLNEMQRAQLIGEEVKMSLQTLSAEEKFQAAMTKLKEQIGRIFGDGQILDSLADSLIKFTRYVSGDQGNALTSEERKNPDLEEGMKLYLNGKLSEMDKKLLKEDLDVLRMENDEYNNKYMMHRKKRLHDLIQADKETRVNDAVISPQGHVIKSGAYGSIRTNPSDYLIATPNPSAVMGGSNDALLKQILQAIQQGNMAFLDELRKGMTINMNGTKLNQELSMVQSNL